MYKLDNFICGDCLEVMSQYPDEFFDLVVTSPPYNLRTNHRGSGGMLSKPSGKWKSCKLAEGYTEYEDNMPYPEYVEWQRNCLKEMLRLIPENGAVFYNHKWRVQGGLIQDRYEIVKDFPVRQIIIWKRKGGVNFNQHFFLPTYEVIYLIAKPKFKLVPKANAVGDVWEIAQEFKNPHPAPFPVELAERIIKSTSAEKVLDPFMGSGSTAIASVKLGRKFVGIDKSEEYCQMAKDRLTGYIESTKE